MTAKSDPTAIAFARPSVGDAEAESVAEVLRSGWIVGGSRLAEFEERFAALCGAPYAVGVSSWTTGAYLVLRALGIGPGDEVIVPSLTFIASVNVIAHVGATPVFVDVDARTWNIDPAKIEKLITSRTRAILPIDQLGLPCDMDAVNDIAGRRGLLVLEDAACAFASRNNDRPIGSLCGTTVFSLHARKVVTTGEGGMIATSDRELCDRLRRLRHQGMSMSDHVRHNLPPTNFETFPEIGYNFRITDLQAAVGLRQLDRLDTLLACRAAAAARYSAHLEHHPLVVPPFVPQGMTPNWQTYQVSMRAGAGIGRNELMDRLHARGIPTRRGVMASHREAPYRNLPAQLPHTEVAADTTLQLPMHAGLTATHLDRILEAIDGIAAEAGLT